MATYLQNLIEHEQTRFSFCFFVHGESDSAQLASCVMDGPGRYMEREGEARGRIKKKVLSQSLLLRRALARGKNVFVSFFFILLFFSSPALSLCLRLVVASWLRRCPVLYALCLCTSLSTSPRTVCSVRHAMRATIAALDAMSLATRPSSTFDAPIA
jgi:hypothetical protein